MTKLALLSLGVLACAAPAGVPEVAVDAPALDAAIGVDAGDAAQLATPRTASRTADLAVAPARLAAVPSADLRLTNTDSRTTVVAGATTTYTVTVANAGAVLVTGAAVTEAFPAALTSVTWTCSASAGGSCPAGGTGNLGALATVAPAGTAAFAITGVVDPSATGTLATTAIVSAPGTITDPDPSNNVASDSDAIVVAADLAVAITDAPDPVAPGGTVTYAIAVTDVGPSTATGLTVTDTLPAGATLVSAGGAGWTCAPGAGIATCTRPALLPGAAPPIAIVVTAPGSPGAMSDTATVAATSADPNPANNAATQTTAVGPSADLAIAITDALDPVPLAGAETYAVQVTNLGPGAAANLGVTDTLPAGTAFVSASGTGWACSQAGVTVTCTRPALAVGAAPPIAIALTAPSAAGPIVDAASVAATSTDPVAANNTASQATTVAASADLAIAVVDSADPVGAGAMLTYLATVTNAGPNPAATVTVTETLSAGVAIASATGAGWTCTHAGASATCTRPALAVGAAPAIAIVVTAPAPGTLTDTAAVATTSIDPQPANNTATQTTTVIASADLAIAIADGADPVVLGGSETYTLAVTNAGPSAATGLTVTDTLPSGAMFVSASGPGWTCARAGATVTCTRPALAVGAAPPIAIAVTVPSTAGAISDAATVAATTSDPSAGNNAATQQTTVEPGADLAIALVATPSPVAAGGALTYTATVANLGPNPATNVAVTDALPAGAVVVGASGSGWQCAVAASVVTCTRPALAVGPAPAIAIAVTAPTAAGTLTTTATVATATLDPVPANDRAIATTPVIASADLAVAIAGPPGPVVVGGAATLVVTATNHGPSTAVATVTTTLPPGALLVGASGAGWTCTGATCACASLAIGDAPPIAIAIVLPGAPGPAITSVHIAGTTPDPDPTNDTATTTTTVSPPPSADLAIALAAPPDPVVQGGALAYTATVANLGPDTAANVAVIVALPEGAGLASATGAGWTCATASLVVTCTAAALPVGAAPAIAIAATAPALPGVATAGADVRATTADPVAANDAATASTAIAPVGPPPRADVAIAIADDGPVVAHHPLTFTVRVASLGPDAPADLVVQIALPAEAAAVIAGAGWTCVAEAQLVTCRAAAMTTAPIAVSVIAPAAGTEIATATVSAATSDPVASNDAATDTVEVTPDLTIRGSGCDAGGGGSGALAIVAVIGLALRRRRLALVAGGALALPAAAAAQSFPIERMRVAIDRDGVLGAEWAGAPGPGTWNVGTWIGYAADPLVLADRETGARVEALVHRRFDGGLFGALGLTRWLEVGVELPVIYAQDASGPVMGALASSTRGDLRLAPKLVLRQGADRVGVALVVGFTLPTGGGNAYAGDRGATFDPELIASRAWGGLRLTGDLGYVARRAATVMDLTVDDELHARLGAGYRFARAPLELDAMAGLATAAARPFAQINTDPREVDVAIQYGDELAVFALGGAGIGGGFGSPDYRVVLGLRVTGSAPAPAARRVVLVAPDHDRMTDRDDARPLPPIERDGDAIADRLDDRWTPPPLVTIAPGKLDLAERVYFHSDGDVLEARSYPLLDSIAALLAAHPELARIRVVGHTDDRGGAGHNRRLSRRRAVAVVAYLVEHGVAAQRLEAMGLGQAWPIADNLSAAGRAANRRVELVIAR